MEYNVRCAVFDGPQFTTDKHDVWVLLCHAVQEGPGWAYVSHYKDSDESTGDARAAFLALYEQTFSQTNVAAILDKVRRAMHDSRYTGDSRNYDFEKHCRAWMNHRTTLVNHNKFSDEQDFTMLFIHTIHDERLENAKLQAIGNDNYTNNFTECVAFFKKALGLSKIGATKAKQGHSIFSVSHDDRDETDDDATSTCSDIIEDKYYSEKEYNSLSNEQRAALYEVRHRKKQRLDDQQSVQ